MSEITNFPPLLSSDIALSILTVKVLFMWNFIYLIKVVSLKQNLSILLYEKEKILNSILHYQISKYDNYNLLILENDEELHDTVTDKSFDAFILNSNNLNDNIINLINIFRQKNKDINIIAYHEPLDQTKIDNTDKLFLLEKPFKLITLLNYLDNINNLETLHN